MLPRISSSAGMLARLAAAQALGSSAGQQGAAAAGCALLRAVLGRPAAPADPPLALLSIAAPVQRGFATNSHDVFNVHNDEAHNNWNTEFDFTEANYKRVSVELGTGFP
jgi:hypothetical protein